MAAAQCEILFKIDYTSSVPVTSANSSASYRIVGPGYPTSTITVDPDAVIALPQIQAPGNYDLEVELTVGGVTATASEPFKIGDCTGEKRTVFYNHAKNIRQGNDQNSEVEFSIKKNGVRMVMSDTPNIDYNNPIEKWRFFEAKVGDYIEFTTVLTKSGTDGKTGGSMYTCSTTGINGTVNGTAPTASGLKVLNSQPIGPASGTVRIFAFQVESKVNYALGTDFFQ
ncbi:hypothetical protein FY557_05515 [Chryseobacterium sp. SN22]|uniref:hypothetical protein n=1 Tax=Chryseobacterium sp. SN22 TaxID=2606431 RepID=UPI0011EE0124|nr:hypothetical protein [Chryseobacterium sp. SN22]KAA0129357.1 hypothetical protein FY557_05515 [Chryseobacterium sp. SN22]